MDTAQPATNLIESSLSEPEVESETDFDVPGESAETERHALFARNLCPRCPAVKREKSVGKTNVKNVYCCPGESGWHGCSSSPSATLGWS